MSCQGKTRHGQGSTRGQGVYKCKHCGAVGCDSNDCYEPQFLGRQVPQVRQEHGRRTRPGVLANGFRGRGIAHIGG